MTIAGRKEEKELRTYVAFITHVCMESRGGIVGKVKSIEPEQETEIVGTTDAAGRTI